MGSWRQDVPQLPDKEHLELPEPVRGKEGISPSGHRSRISLVGLPESNTVDWAARTTEIRFLADCGLEVPDQGPAGSVSGASSLPGSQGANFSRGRERAREFSCVSSYKDSNTIKPMANSMILFTHNYFPICPFS